MRNWRRILFNRGRDPAIATLVEQATQALERGELESAALQFKAVLARSPREAAALHALGFLAAQRHELAQAHDYLRAAVHARPDAAAFQSDLGNVLRLRGDLPAAIDAYRRALALDPNRAQSHADLGAALQYSGRLDEAKRALGDAWRLDPKNPVRQLAYAVLLLFQGNYTEGFHLYDARLHIASDEFARLLDWYGRAGVAPWLGEALEGKRLIVWAEQGIGDALMMLRYLPLLKERGLAELTLHCFATLEKLAAQIPGVDHVVVDAASALGATGFDYHCPIMSLPLRCATRLDSIPAAMPYLHIPQPLALAWRERLAALPGRRIGLVWAGGPLLRDDAARSMALAQLEPLIALPDVSFVSLQKGPPAQQLRERSWPIADFMDQCDDLLDTAACVQALDLVISVDTAVAHLAGALGKPVWLLDRYGSEWRWMTQRSDSPWYPTLRIFRQSQPGDWSGVLRQVAQELR